MADQRPIGLFDSGIGGLSVWREVIRCLPDEATNYYADSMHCPYGSRPATEVRLISSAITRFLLKNNCKLIVVACNTASAAALETLRAEFKVPIIGMEPALKPAAEASKAGRIGVLATAGTVQGKLFQNTLQRHANGIQVSVQVADGLVEQVEAGHLDTLETEMMLRQYLEPMLKAGVDQIVLGCTHYPLLMPLIQRIVAGRAKIIDPARAVAQQVRRVLISKNALRMQDPQLAADSLIPKYRFFAPTEAQLLRRLATAFSGQSVEVLRITADSLDRS